MSDNRTKSQSVESKNPSIEDRIRALEHNWWKKVIGGILATVLACGITVPMAWQFFYSTLVVKLEEELQSLLKKARNDADEIRSIKEGLQPRYITHSVTLGFNVTETKGSRFEFVAVPKNGDSEKWDLNLDPDAENSGKYLAGWISFGKEDGNAGETNLSDAKINYLYVDVDSNGNLMLHGTGYPDGKKIAITVIGVAKPSRKD